MATIPRQGQEPKGDAMSTEGIDFETGQWVYWDQGKLVGPNSMFALREMAQNNEIPYGISLERVEDKVWRRLQDPNPQNPTSSAGASATREPAGGDVQKFRW